MPKRQKKEFANKTEVTPNHGSEIDPILYVNQGARILRAALDFYLALSTSECIYNKIKRKYS